MKENPVEFQYSWQDLKAVRALLATVFVAQLIGAAVSLEAEPTSRWFDNFWLGGTLATFPGFLIGFLIQKGLQPESNKETKSMVQRMGLIAVILTLAAIFFPEIGFFYAL